MIFLYEIYQHMHGDIDRRQKWPWNMKRCSFYVKTEKGGFHEDNEALFTGDRGHVSETDGFS